MTLYFDDDSHIPVPVTHTEPVASLLRSLALERVDENTYRGESVVRVTPRVYGGQVQAQAVMAADDHVRRTMGLGENDRLAHSITGAFLRPGDINIPIDFQVMDLHDGHSFSTRTVIARQKDEIIFEARVSLQELQPGPSIKEEAPKDVPAPDEVPSSMDFFASLHNKIGNLQNACNGIDLRHVNGDVYVHPTKSREPRQYVWMRTRSRMPEGSSRTLQRAMLAYAADQIMLEPVMRGVGVSWMMPGVALATLDHSIWWHRNFDISDWILADMYSPSAQNGRGLGLAKFYQDGRLIATMAQEGMVRRNTERTIEQ